MAKGEIRSIHTCHQAGDPMTSLGEVAALRGEGLAGDRYLHRSGTYSKTHGPDREVTLIEAETLDALQAELGFTLAPAETRRNLVSRGIALDALIGKRFRVGEEVVLAGVRRCDPCGYLERTTGKPVYEPLRERGGLRATIVQGGTLRVGDVVEALAEPEAVEAVPAPART